MFIETHPSKTDGGTPLVFIKSLNINAFPCGRRRSTLIDTSDLDGNGHVEESEKYYIPFDPEARLNTEANNRRHTALNGFTDTYISKWDSGCECEKGNEHSIEHILSLVLAGYLFNIKLDSGYFSANDFGNKLIEAILNYNKNFDTSQVNKIYANIRIDNTPLFSGFTEYSTSVLRDQIVSEKANTEIDILNTTTLNGTDNAAKQLPENFYFSGLSFSVEPLTEKADLPYSVSNVFVNNTDEIRSRTVSLCILERVDSTWQIYQPALLPNVKHGPTENSVEFDTIFASEINAEKITQNGNSVPLIKIVKQSDDTYQLQFSMIEEE